MTFPFAKTSPPMPGILVTTPIIVRLARLFLSLLLFGAFVPALHASIIGVKDCDCVKITIQLTGFPNNPVDVLVVKLSKITSNGSKLAPVEIPSVFNYAAQTITLARPAGLVGGAYWIEIFRNGVVFANQNINICDCLVDCGAPFILLTQDCPLVPVAAGGLLTYSGVVRNTGNITLSNVVVVNNRSQAFAGTSAAFVQHDTVTKGSWKNNYGADGYNIIANAVSYPAYAQVTPTGKFDYTWSTSTNDVRALEKVGSTNRIAATWYAPVSFSIHIKLTDGLKHRVAFYAVDWDTTARSEKVEMLDTVSGAVLNSQTLSGFHGGDYLVWDLSGDVTVRFTHLAGNNALLMGMFFDPTPVFTIASLAPGASAAFTGSFVAPADCSVTSVSVATGYTLCGVVVTNSLTETCAISTAPAISLAEICPTSPVLAGSSVTFGGFISNTGNVGLTNIFVFSSEVGGVPVSGPFSLAPGGATNFTGVYIAKASNASTNITILTNSSSVVTTNLTSLITTNVTSLVTTNLTGSVTTNTVLVITTNSVGAILTNSVSVITTNTTSTFVTNAAAGPTLFGTINTLASTAVDRFTVGQDFNGLTYAGEDHGYGATDFYSIRKASGGSSFFDTITAGTATTTDRFAASNRNFDSLAYAAPDLGYGPLLFYYLSHDNAGVSTFGSITPGGVVGVTADHFVVGNNFDAITFTATDVGYGANLFYYVRHDANGVSTFGTINPALPGTITDRFTVGKNVDALVFTDLIAPGYGPNNFYYLRHDASGVSTFGTILVTGLASGTVTDRFQVGTNANELTFTATDVGFGANLFYFLRGPGVTVTTNLTTLYATNTVITFTTNTVPSFTTNSVSTFTTNNVASYATNFVSSYVTNFQTAYITNTVPSYITNRVVSYSSTNLITVTGMDTCQSRLVTASAKCVTTVILPFVPITEMPSLANGSYRFAFASEVGKSYTVQYKNTLNDVGWTTLQVVTGTGGNMIIMDGGTSLHSSRFYRVIPTP